MSNKQNETAAQDETVLSREVPINEFIAAKLEVLAERVRQGEVTGFDLAWNLGKLTETPHKFAGVMLTNAYRMDDYLMPSFEPEESVEKIQRDINKVLATPVIEVEDRTVSQNVVLTDPEIPSEDEEIEDFHIIDDDTTDGEE